MGESLSYLIAQATALAGGNPCLTGHAWGSFGGRPCPHGHDECSQIVYRCSRCGLWDHGDPGGPGHADCEDRACRH